MQNDSSHPIDIILWSYAQFNSPREIAKILGINKSSIKRIIAVAKDLGFDRWCADPFEIDRYALMTKIRMFQEYYNER